MKNATLTEEETNQIALQFLAQYPKVTLGWLTLPDAMKVNSRVVYLMTHHGADNLYRLIEILTERGELDNVKGVKRVSGTLDTVKRMRDATVPKTSESESVDLGTMVNDMVKEVSERLN